MSTSLITAQQDSVKIPRKQIKNIYIGLKQSESYREYYSECLQYSDSLVKIINDQDRELQSKIKILNELNVSESVLNDKIIKNEIDIQRLKSKKIPWYKHPILYGILGFIGGIYLMK